MTFTIIGIDKKKKELGLASFSKAFGVGAIVPTVKLKLGAIATQCYPNMNYHLIGIKLLKEFTPKEALSKLISRDKEKEKRQVMLMNLKGKSAGFTGNQNPKYAGMISGKNFICAGNTLVGKEVLEEIKKTFENSKKDLAEKLIQCLFSAEKVGGDRRKRLFGSSCLIIEKKNKGLLGIGNRYIDIRIDYSKNAIKDLQQLLKIAKKN